jgi:gluconate 5-dehydrogenase
VDVDPDETVDVDPDETVDVDPDETVDVDPDETVGELAGSRVLVSGASSGLGLAMARALLGAGASVAITSRSGERARQVAAELGPRALGLELDVREEASVAAAVEEAYAVLGGLELLVSNAGIGMRAVNPSFMTRAQPFWEVPSRGFRDVFATKVTGSFLLAREVVPRMLSAGAGRIVCISMNEQTMIRRGFVPYGPSGAAVEALARVMAADLADSAVRVNILLPGGATATGMIPDGVAGEIRDNLLDPAIMGAPIVWLASEEAAELHGERLVATEFDRWLAERA